LEQPLDYQALRCRLKNKTRFDHILLSLRKRKCDKALAQLGGDKGLGGGRFRGVYHGEIAVRVCVRTQRKLSADASQSTKI